jgi:hypothetical protein
MQTENPQNWAYTYEPPEQLEPWNELTNLQRIKLKLS